MGTIRGFEFTESEFEDILQALHSEAHSAVNVFNEGEYNRFMRLSGRLTAQRAVLINISARRNKIKEAVAIQQESVKVSSSMNWDETPTFTISTYSKK